MIHFFPIFDFSMDNLEAFVNDLLNDKLEPYLKSEPVPEDNSGGVKVGLSPFVVFKITKCYTVTIFCSVK